MLNTILAQAVSCAFKEQHNAFLPIEMVEKMEQVGSLTIFALDMYGCKFIATFNGANPFDVQSITTKVIDWETPALV